MPSAVRLLDGSELDLLALTPHSENFVATCATVRCLAGQRRIHKGFQIRQFLGDDVAPGRVFEAGTARSLFGNRNNFSVCLHDLLLSGQRWNIDYLFLHHRCRRHIWRTGGQQKESSEQCRDEREHAHGISPIERISVYTAEKNSSQTSERDVTIYSISYYMYSVNSSSPKTIQNKQTKVNETMRLHLVIHFMLWQNYTCKNRHSIHTFRIILGKTI